MINEKEKQAVTLSPTKKDFYQIWNELLDTATKLSERWDPSSTNESDPGIVLLKVLTAIADKLNYTIDKNTLEAFMPSAAQEESMRKLCEMLGYDMKYYRSATTRVLLSWISKESMEGLAYIDRFSNIKDTDDTINYVTTEEVSFNADGGAVEIPCIEGELVECETDSDNIISISLLDDNNRYYLPERQIAENGIFITNIVNGEESDFWIKVDNLNTHPLNKQIYKFGYDSTLNVPYIQFPSDISAIIEDGLRIRYIRTHGINGNISARTLCKLEKPISWTSADASDEDENKNIYNENNYSAINHSAAINGTNPETLKQAYNNYKKTIGTFDTLVTCRDYMNKIYQLTVDEVDTTPLVSNVIVSDIRDDINRAITICSFNNYGIYYSDSALKDISDEDKINHFDLIIYPFKVYNNLGTENDYNGSFTYNPSVIGELLTNETLEKYKTISHNIKLPESLGENEIICIKNYLRLKAKITTTKKVNQAEEKDILKTIFKAIYNEFNLRNLDFGEEIPFDDILACIENADSRIKNVALEEPVLYTKFLCSNGSEYDTIDNNTAKVTLLWRKLAARNILSGRVPLFSYNTNFEYDYTEAIKDTYGKDYNGKAIGKIIPKYIPNVDDPESGDYIYSDLTLGENEVIKFRAPNFRTTVTYPAYVNYHACLKQTSTAAIPATFMSLADFMNKADDDNTNWDILANGLAKAADKVDKYENITDDSAFNTLVNKYTQVFKKVDSDYIRVASYDSSITTYYGIPFDDSTFASLWYNFVRSNDTIRDNTAITLSGMYRKAAATVTRPYGYLVDANHQKLNFASEFRANIDKLSTIFVQETFEETTDEHTADGLGRNSKDFGSDGEYQLSEGEYIVFNYTTSDTVDGVEQKYVHNVIYTTGDIIKPNFPLIDSNTKNTSGTSWTKTKVDITNYTYGDPKKSGSFPETELNMFTLGANEQIEIREKAQITLDKPYTNIYWELQDETPNQDGQILFFEPGKTKRILKDGEYFYYTDAYKSEFTFYGAGSEISRSSLQLKVYKSKDDPKISTAEIAERGLLASIPWKAYKLGSGANDYQIVITEYQYKTLTQTDTINTLQTEKQLGVYDEADDNGNWTTVISPNTQYNIDGTSYSLPAIAVDDVNWEATSLLNLNVGPTTAQKIGYSESGLDELTLIYKDAGGEQKIPNYEGGWETDEQYAFKTNYECIASQESVKTDIIQYINDEPVEINDFSVKVFTSTAEDDKIVNKYGSYNNFDMANRLTRISIDDFKPTISNSSNTSTETTTNAEPISCCIPITISIPKGTKEALLMVYCAGGKTGEGEEFDNAYIKLSNTPAGLSDGLLIYNYYINGTNSWWKDYASGTGDNAKYYLKPDHISVIKLPILTDGSGTQNTSYTLSFNYDFETSGSTIVNSNINIIFGNVSYISGLNEHIGIGKDLLSDEATALFKDLRQFDSDHIFYYTNTTDKSLLIDFNTNVIENTAETLLDPYSWYSYNNINNKFVISQIDTEYMKKGITLTKSSKL